MRLLLAFFVFIFQSNSLLAQTEAVGKKIPNITIKDLQGNYVNTSEIHNNGKPFIISFWATYCKPCVREYNSLMEVYEEWKEETGVKIFAISVDDARTKNNVRPFIKSKGWEFEFYLDENSEFKRAMNVTLIPHTFICNGDGEVVWQHTSFAEGQELEMIKILRNITRNNQ